MSIHHRCICRCQHTETRHRFKWFQQQSEQRQRGWWWRWWQNSGRVPLQCPGERFHFVTNGPTEIVKSNDYRLAHYRSPPKWKATSHPFLVGDFSFSSLSIFFLSLLCCFINDFLPSRLLTFFRHGWRDTVAIVSISETDDEYVIRDRSPLSSFGPATDPSRRLRLPNPIKKRA